MADKDAIKRFAEQQGILLFEIEDGGSRLLLSQDPRVKDLGAKIIREFYRLGPSDKLTVVEGQD